MLVLGHRGASREAPENTRAAFRRALAVGAHGVELDVRRTLDGALLCLHDAELGRTVPGTGQVEETAAAALRGADAGAWFHPQFAGEPIPTLAEALATCAEADLVMVEAKAPDGDRDLMLPGISEALVAFLRDRRGGPPLLVASLTWPILREIHEASPAQPIGAIVGRPMGTAEWGWLLSRPLAVVALGADLATPERLRDLAAAGREAYVWTVNDPAEARRLRDAGVAAVITDDPAAIAAALQVGR